MASQRKPQPSNEPTALRGDLDAPDYLIKVGPFALNGMGNAWTVDLVGRWTEFEARIAERKPVTDAELGEMFTVAFGAANPEYDGDALRKAYPPLVQLKAMRGFFQRWQQDLTVSVEDTAPSVAARRVG